MSEYAIKDYDNNEVLIADNTYLDYPYYIKPHSHRMLELSIIKSGNGIYEINDKRYDIAQFDVFLLGNSDLHHIVLKKGEHVHNMVMHFDPEFLWTFRGHAIDYSFLSPYFNRSPNFSHRLDRNNPSTMKIFNWVNEIEKNMNNEIPYIDLSVKIILEKIMYEIICHYDYCLDRELDNPRLMRNDAYKIHEVKKYVELNIKDDLSLKELSQIACVSPAYFSSVFKKYVGITLSEYIAKKRIEYAIQLIKTTDKYFTEIATQSGFNNSTNFIKSFKKFTGLTPSEFKKRIMSMNVS